MEEKRLLNMLREVVEDKNKHIRYWVDVEGYKKAIECLTNSDIQRELELKTDAEGALRKKVERFNNYIFGTSSDATKGSVELLKNLGRALEGDEYAFLKAISLASFTKIINEMKIKKPYLEEAREIYSRLNQILYLLETSYYFNYVPKTDACGEIYFAELMDQVRREVDSIFGDDRGVRNVLYKLIDEVDYIINICEVPGVPESWFTANPKIRYFDCVFLMIEENPELYFKIKKRNMLGSRIGFNFWPSEKEIRDRQAFFKEKRCQYPNRTEDRLYQDELIETLNLRFNECVEDIHEISS